MEHQEYGRGHEDYSRADEYDRSADMRADKPHGTEYRLSAHDERRIVRAIVAVWQSWGSPGVISLELFDALVRAGAQAIDCWVSDLREIERVWICDQVNLLLVTTGEGE